MTWSYSTIFSFVMLAYLMRRQLVASIPHSRVGDECNGPNKNPCNIFPGLCSAGGGLCIVKAPCEYQCVCPPDGRTGRDCTSNSSLEHGEVVESLVIFPKDVFFNSNSSVKHSTNSAKTTAQVTTSRTSATQSTLKATTAQIIEQITQAAVGTNSQGTLALK